MQQRRRDSRNRLLNKGETQRKDGRYAYTYIDSAGSRKTVYSWRLVATDTAPAGKRPCVPLRELEREIKRKSSLELREEEITVLDLVNRYLAVKDGLSPNTLISYKRVAKYLEKDELGAAKVCSIRKSSGKAFFVRLKREKGLSYSSAKQFKNVLTPAFAMAADDGLTERNPFDFQLCEVLKAEHRVRAPLSQELERRVLEFVRADKSLSGYYDGLFIMFKTGVRVSELAGLTVHDLDFTNEQISVSRQLIKAEGAYKIIPPKTRAGVRVIPMSASLSEGMKRLAETVAKREIQPEIEGISGFLFLTRKGRPAVSGDWDGYFRSITAKYNRTHKKPLPAFTPHVCRHTYCTDMAKLGVSPKTLQYLMGHDDISTTYNVYTHARAKDVKDELDSLGIL